MANMQMEEREIIMDKMVAASRDILGTIADMGYLDEYETPLTPMEERGYYDEEGNLDIDAVEADGYEFGMDLAFGVLSVCEGKPEHVLEIQKYVNEQYECCSNKKFMKVLETIARMNGNEEVVVLTVIVSIGLSHLGTDKVNTSAGVTTIKKLEKADVSEVETKISNIEKEETDIQN